MTGLVGLDVGTTGVKAIAISPDGDVLARAERGVPALDAAARLGGAGSRGLVARERGGARGGSARTRSPASASPGRCTGSSRSTRPTGCSGPAILWNDQRTARRVRRDRGAHRARAADRAHRQPGAHRLHRAEAALAAPPRAGGLRADRARAAAEGLRPAAPHGRARDRRRRRVRARSCFDVAQPPLERRGAATRSRSRRRGCPPRSSRRTVSGSTPRTGSRSPPAPATRPPARSASGVDRPGPLSVVLGTSGVVFAALPALRAPTRRRACTRSATRCPATWHAMGVMLSAAGSLRWLRDARAGGVVRRARRRGRGAGAPGAEGLLVRARTSPASGRRTPTRDARGAFAGPDAPPRPRRARPRRARGRRLRPARLARARCASSASAPSAGARLGRRRAQRALAADRRLGARPAARADGGRGGRGLRRRAARRRRRRASSPTCTRRSRRCVRVRDDGRARPRAGRRAYEDGYPRFRALYPALDHWRSR